VPTSLFSRLPMIAAELGPEVESALEKVAETVAESAQEKVPVESGDLRDAIHVEKQDDGYSVVAGNERVFYGHLVEHGTTHSPPRPFLIPAAEESLGTAEKLVENALEDL
jgi:HK97 gp10 family phage protein